MFHEGQQIGLYTLIGKLGTGGFGEVWLAERKSKFVTTKVAVKLPLAVRNIVIKSLKKEPSERYQTANEMLKDLSQFLKGNIQPSPSTSPTPPTQPFPSPPKPKVNWLYFAVPAIILLIFTIIGGYWLFSGEPNKNGTVGNVKNTANTTTTNTATNTATSTPNKTLTDFNVMVRVKENIESFEVIVDSKEVDKVTLSAESLTKKYSPEQSFIIKYAKDQRSDISVMLNGKELTLPSTEMDCPVIGDAIEKAMCFSGKLNVKAEITRESIVQITQSGQIPPIDIKPPS